MDKRSVPFFWQHIGGTDALNMTVGWDISDRPAGEIGALMGC
jgi:hypothetical protein